MIKRVSTQVFEADAWIAQENKEENPSSKDEVSLKGMTVEVVHG